MNDRPQSAGRIARQNPHPSNIRFGNSGLSAHHRITPAQSGLVKQIAS
jgi:hypothetical protein